MSYGYEYNLPKKEDALAELNIRKTDVKVILRAFANRCSYMVPEECRNKEAEEKNLEIINRDIEALENGADPREVMHKYHRGGPESRLSGSQCYAYNPRYPNSFPEV